MVSDTNTFEIPLSRQNQSGKFSVPAASLGDPNDSARNSRAFNASRNSTANARPDQHATKAFVGGDENRLVRTAIESLLNPQADGGFRPNPLVLCGRSGIGKSLLANCLASQWQATNLGQQAKTLQLTGDDWARGYVSAVRDDKIVAWREHVRSAALFVIDDVPQLLRQHTAQRELILLLDDLIAAGTPVIATMLTDPTVCEGMDPALASRLNGGLVLELQPPGRDARQRIIGQITDSFPRKITPDAIQWFAEQFSGSVPALQNALLGCLYAAKNKVTTNQPANAIGRPELRRLYTQWLAHQRVSLKSITKSVSRYCQVAVKDMTGASRRQSFVQARSLAMYLAKQLSGEPLRAIGHHFGGRDHTTVMHACQKIEAAQTTDPTIRLAIDELTQILRGPN